MLTLVLKSLSVHRCVPAGAWRLPVPRNTVLSTRPTTLRFTELCSRTNTHPCLITLPTPVYGTPAQQNRNWPVTEFHRSIVVGFDSSCSATSNVVTVKLQVAVLPEASVAVQVTVVTPIFKQVPDGGTHATVTPGQLSSATGSGNVTT
jgi:hypothetical protein